MIDIRYGTASDPRWHAMVSPTCVLVVDRSLPADRVHDLQTSVAGAAGVQAVLDALTRGGISSTPSFALAVLPTGFGSAPTSIAMIVRGQLDVFVTSRSEKVRISGAGVSTWVEQVVPDAVYLEIGVRGSVDRSKSSIDTYVLNDGSAPVEWLSAGSEGETELMAVPVLPPAASSAPPVDLAVDPGVTITDPTFVSAEAATGPDGGYDFLFGETVVRTVEGAAVRDGLSDPSITEGDHDGRTAVGLSAAERRAARQARHKPAASVVSAAPEFVLTFSTGEREPLDHTLIIGRAPSASKVSATSVPRLVTVGGPDQDISRNHVQAAVEGGTVLITDLHSRNGTMVSLPGRPPQQLRGGQPTAVISGAVVDLGSGISFTVGES